MRAGLFSLDGYGRGMRREGIPLYTLESRTPVREMDFLGITIQYEMCYTQHFTDPGASGIPLKACERDEDCPIVIGGGPCAYNPEPMADFFDLFYIGEGETQYDALLDLDKEVKKAGGGRAPFLERAASIPGIYVPSFYDVEYNEDGTIRSMTPNNPHAPPTGKAGAGIRYDHGPLSRKAAGSLPQGDPGPGGSGDSAGLHQRLRFCQAGMATGP